MMSTTMRHPSPPPSKRRSPTRDDDDQETPFAVRVARLPATLRTAIMRDLSHTTRETYARSLAVSVGHDGIAEQRRVAAAGLQTVGGAAHLDSLATVVRFGDDARRAEVVHTSVLPHHFVHHGIRHVVSEQQPADVECPCRGTHDTPCVGGRTTSAWLLHMIPPTLGRATLVGNHAHQRIAAVQVSVANEHFACGNIIYLEKGELIPLVIYGILKYLIDGAPIVGYMDSLTTDLTFAAYCGHVAEHAARFCDETGYGSGDALRGTPDQLDAYTARIITKWFTSHLSPDRGPDYYAVRHQQFIRSGPFFRDSTHSSLTRYTVLVEWFSAPCWLSLSASDPPTSRSADTQYSTIAPLPDITARLVDIERHIFRTPHTTSPAAPANATAAEAAMHRIVLCELNMWAPGTVSRLIKISIPSLRPNDEPPTLRYLNAWDHGSLPIETRTVRGNVTPPRCMTRRIKRAVTNTIVAATHSVLAHPSGGAIVAAYVVALWKATARVHMDSPSRFDSAVAFAHEKVLRYIPYHTTPPLNALAAYPPNSYLRHIGGPIECVDSQIIAQTRIMLYACAHADLLRVTDLHTTPHNVAVRARPSSQPYNITSLLGCYSTLSTFVYGRDNYWSSAPLGSTMRGETATTVIPSGQQLRIFVDELRCSLFRQANAANPLVAAAIADIKDPRVVAQRLGAWAAAFASAGDHHAARNIMHIESTDAAVRTIRRLIAQADGDVAEGAYSASAKSRHTHHDYAAIYYMLAPVISHIILLEIIVMVQEMQHTGDNTWLTVLAHHEDLLVTRLAHGERCALRAQKWDNADTNRMEQRICLEDKALASRKRFVERVRQAPENTAWCTSWILDRRPITSIREARGIRMAIEEMGRHPIR